MVPYVKELEENTRWYWRISQALNGRSLEQIPAFKAIDICNRICWNVNPARPLPHKMRQLRAEVIAGDSIAHEQTSSNIIVLEHRK